MSSVWQALCCKLNHFAKACKTKPGPNAVHATLANTSDNTSDELMFSLTLTPDEVNSLGDSSYQKRIVATMLVGNRFGTLYMQWTIR